MSVQCNRDLNFRASRFFLRRCMCSEAMKLFGSSNCAGAKTCTVRLLENATTIPFPQLFSVMTHTISVLIRTEKLYPSGNEASVSGRKAWPLFLVRLIVYICTSSPRTMFCTTNYLRHAPVTCFWGHFYSTYTWMRPMALTRVWSCYCAQTAVFLSRWWSQYLYAILLKNCTKKDEINEWEL